MLEAAAQHNHPPPASETVIEGLPRLRLDQETLGEFEDGPLRATMPLILARCDGACPTGIDSIQQTNSSCNICFYDFQLDEEVVKIPCK
jgi:hypothetical protein